MTRAAERGIAVASRPSGRGRPAATTCDTIEEAACELFLEQGYDATSVADIARRAGVSRSSFFNYFSNKADVLWGPVLRTLEGVPDALAAAEARVDDDAGSRGAAVAPTSEGRAVAILRAAALDLARGVTADCIPVPVAQADAMAAATAVAETGAVLLAGQRDAALAAVRRLDPGGDDLRHAAFAAALVGGVAAAVAAWMRAGTRRSELAAIVERAIDPVCRGFADER